MMQIGMVGLETPKSQRRKIQLTDSGSKSEGSEPVSPTESFSSLIEQTLGYRTHQPPNIVYDQKRRTREGDKDGQQENDTFTDFEDLLAQFSTAFENEDMFAEFDEDFSEDHGDSIDQLEDGTDKIDKIKVLSALLAEYKSHSREFLEYLANYQVSVQTAESHSVYLATVTCSER